MGYSLISMATTGLSAAAREGTVLRNNDCGCVTSDLIVVVDYKVTVYINPQSIKPTVVTAVSPILMLERERRVGDVVVVTGIASHLLWSFNALTPPTCISIKM